MKFDDNKLLSGLTMAEIKQKEESLKLSELTFFQKISPSKLKEYIAKEKQDIAKD